MPKEKSKSFQEFIKNNPEMANHNAVRRPRVAVESKVNFSWVGRRLLGKQSVSFIMFVALCLFLIHFLEEQKVRETRGAQQNLQALKATKIAWENTTLKMEKAAESRRRIQKLLKEVLIALHAMQSEGRHQELEELLKSLKKQQKELKKMAKQYQKDFSK